jgi:LuxR family maltose regulon positive regulatory protein
VSTSGQPHLRLAVVPDAPLGVPQFPPGMVRRDELLQRVERSAAALDCLTVALLTAPAGFGKTTVAAQWATARRARGDVVAWVRCTTSEGDEPALVGLIVDALAQAFLAQGDPHGTSQRLRALAAPTSDGIASFGVAVADLLQSASVPVALVVDDLHHVRHEQTIRDLGRLLTCLPASVTVLVTSRVDDPVISTQLRLRTHLVHLVADDLAFGPQHLRQVVGSSHAHDPASLVSHVHRYTAGWPAAARLALLPSSAPAMPTAPLSPVDADAVHDFIWAEVALGLSDDERQLLLDTCVVSQMNVALAHALTGRVDAGAVLVRLVRTQSLLTRTGTDDPWYTVHSLLRTSLLTELSRRDLGAPARQHATAAQWLAGHGYPHLALEHCVAAGNPAQTAALLVDKGLALLAGGHGQIVHQALASVPPAERDVPLQALDLVARLDEAQVPATLPWSWQQPIETGRTDGVPPLPRLAALYWYRVHGGADSEGVRRYFSDLWGWSAPPVVRDADLDAVLLLLTQRGRLAFMLGDSDLAEADLRRAVELAEPARRDLVVLRCLGTTAIILAERGEHSATLAFVAQQLATVEARGWRTHPAVTDFYAVAAWAAHHMLQPERAREYADLATESAAQSADPEYTIAAQIVQAVLTIDRPAERAGGIQALAHVVSLPRDALGSHMRAFAAYSEIRLRLAHADLRGAAAATDRFATIMPGVGDPAPVRALLMLRRRPMDARRLVQPVIRGEVPLELRNSRTWALVIDALAAQRLRDDAGSGQSMLAAIEDAAPRGSGRPFYDVGPAALDLLRRMPVDDPALRAFVEQTLAGAARVDAMRQSSVPAPTAGPRLTRRENEVLRDLPTLLTAEEIAEQQGVSVNTVRTHMRTLYRKLGASNRREAVRIAQRTGLLG